MHTLKAHSVLIKILNLNLEFPQRGMRNIGIFCSLNIIKSIFVAGNPYLMRSSELRRLFWLNNFHFRNID